MSVKHIIGFGDSWIYGDELLDPILVEKDPHAHATWTQNRSYRESHCFLGLLGQYYQVPVINYGIPGGSLQSTTWTFLDWFNNEPNPSDCLILIGLTEADRFSLWNPLGASEDKKMVHSTWAQSGAIEVPPEFRDLMKQQLVLTNCETLRNFTFQQTVLLFDGVAARNNLKLFQFNIADAPVQLNNVPTLVWPDFSWTREFVQELQADFGRIYIKEHGHPNEKGHRLIADRLISYLDSCIIKGC